MLGGRAKSDWLVAHNSVNNCCVTHVTSESPYGVIYGAGLCVIGRTPQLVGKNVSKLFSTDKIALARRFDVWRDMLCTAHAPIECQRLTEKPFSGTSEAAQIDRLGLTRIRSVDQRIDWNQNPRSSQYDGVLLVTLQTFGTAFLVQDGREARVQPGSIAFHESTRPFSWVFPEDFEQLVIRIPRDTLMGRLGHTGRWIARVLDGSHGIGGLVSGFLRHTFSVLGNCSPNSAYRLSQISNDLVGTALEEIQGREQAQNSGRIAFLQRAKQAIEANLHDPELTPTKLAEMLRISLRYLQDLFSDEDTTPSAWIWERRLDRSRRMIADPRFAETTICDIAYECGFTDYSHFNHRFKAAFSLSPSDYKNSINHRILAPIK